MNSELAMLHRKHPSASYHNFTTCENNFIGYNDMAGLLSQ